MLYGRYAIGAAEICTSLTAMLALKKMLESNDIVNTRSRRRRKDMDFLLLFLHTREEEDDDEENEEFQV